MDVVDSDQGRSEKLRLLEIAAILSASKVAQHSADLDDATLVRMVGSDLQIALTAVRNVLDDPHSWA
jgi:hypothetical protein